MAYSTQRVTSDGTLVLLDISIEYFDRSEIAVLFNGVIGTYPWAWVGNTEKKISFSPAVPNTVEVMLVRTTDLAAVRHMFTLGAQFTTQSLDEDLLQILHIAQEAKENATIEEVFHNLNMHGYRIINIGDGIDPQDAPSMAQMVVHDATIVAYRDAAAASAVAAAASAAGAAASAAGLLPGVPLGIATLDGAGKVVQTALTADVATSAGTSANLAGRAQLGTDSNATRNFTLTAEAANGTLKLARGNAGATTQDIMTVDASGVVSFPRGPIVNSCLRYGSINGYGSTHTGVRRFSGQLITRGTDITYTDSVTLGGTFTINTSGVYAITYCDQFGGASWMGLTLNESAGTLAGGITLVAPAEILAAVATSGANAALVASFTGYLSAGTIIRARASGATSGISTFADDFTITRVA